ncbi:hypothetical protein LAZ67_2006932 [Cordylochernes scorpioides]|uniref:Protein kinase domain-containing protein n=1 Tax=Cordylochernes scorpioides TaxID=51811 RepID=A0ABY6K5S2_9ARAC|nr:hypothetical protein LAZ67_2006932 [Cordylochernes scorpioides]
MLNCDQKQHRMNIANEMLDSVRDDPNLLQRVITGDEAGVVHHEFLPQGRTVNKEYYLQVMRNLREAIRQKLPDLWKNKNWLLHHNNAPAHTSLVVRDLLAKNDTLMMPQPPYSSDLAPCDFFLFPKLKRPMKGRRYSTLDEIKPASKEELKKIFKKLFFEVLRRLEKPLAQVLKLGDSIDWVGSGPPLDEPDCGFHNENCVGCTDRSDLIHGQDTTTTSVDRYCDQDARTDLICSMDKTPPPPQLAGCTDRSDLLLGQDTTTTSVGRYCDEGARTDLICSMDKTPPPPQLAGWRLGALITGGVAAVFTVVSLGLYRNWKYEQDLDSLLWRIDYKDIQINEYTPTAPLGKTSRNLLHPVIRSSQISLSSNQDLRYTTIYCRIGVYRGRILAVKQLHRRSFDITRKMKKELKALKDLRHDNLNPFIGACMDPPNFCIVTEYCSRGSLKVGAIRSSATKRYL